METNIIKEIDEALLTVGAEKSIMNVEMDENLLKQLKAMEFAAAEMEFAAAEIEDCLESVSSCRLKTGVSLLNIVSH